MSAKSKLLDFCFIQLQIVKERERMLRKQILDCKIQQEFLESTIEEINISGDKTNEQ